MTLVQINGETLFVTSAPWVDQATGLFRTGTLGLLKADVVAVARRGQRTAIAQMYGLVLQGTILTSHIFKGLKRPLYTDDNMHADREKLTYTRKPSFDCAWVGSKSDGDITHVDPPKGCVFVVYVSPNSKHREKYPSIDGWINYWTWIDEDQALPEAPTDWVSRYDERIWHRA